MFYRSISNFNPPTLLQKETLLAFDADESFIKVLQWVSQEKNKEATVCSQISEHNNGTADCFQPAMWMPRHALSCTRVSCNFHRLVNSHSPFSTNSPPAYFPSPRLLISVMRFTLQIASLRPHTFYPPPLLTLPHSFSWRRGARQTWRPRPAIWKLNQTFPWMTRQMMGRKGSEGSRRFNAAFLYESHGVAPMCRCTAERLHSINI